MQALLLEPTPNRWGAAFLNLWSVSTTTPCTKGVLCTENTAGGASLFLPLVPYSHLCVSIFEPGSQLPQWAHTTLKAGPEEWLHYLFSMRNPLCVTNCTKGDLHSLRTSCSTVSTKLSCDVKNTLLQFCFSQWIHKTGLIDILSKLALFTIQGWWCRLTLGVNR